jgi:hypothetical protein
MKKMYPSILFILLLSSQILGQSQETIKDYFIPVTGKNKTTLSAPKVNNDNLNMIRNIFYIYKNGSYDILTATFINDNTTGIQTMTVQFTNNEVKMTNSVSTTMFETNVKKSYNPPSLILKMPLSGQKAVWETKEMSDDLQKCTAVWTQVQINGEQRKAIKVIKSFEGLSSVENNYYVKGIGLWKIEIEDKTSKMTQFEFMGLEYDPQADKQSSH